MKNKIYPKTEKLKKLKKEKGLTLKEISEITGLSKTSVGRFFSLGKCVISKPAAEKLCSCFNLDFQEYFVISEDVEVLEYTDQEVKKALYFLGNLVSQKKIKSF